LREPLPGYSLGRVNDGADQREKSRRVQRPSLFDLGRFVLFSGVTLLAAWVAAFGRVAYTVIMLVVAAALIYAVLDLVDYEIVKRKRQGWAPPPIRHRGGTRSAQAGACKGCPRAWEPMEPPRSSASATTTPNTNPPTWAKNATPPPLAAAPKSPKLASISW